MGLGPVFYILWRFRARFMVQGGCAKGSWGGWRRYEDRGFRVQDLAFRV